MIWAFTKNILPVCCNHTSHCVQSFPHTLAICYHELSKVKCRSSVIICRSDLLVSDVPAVGTFMLAMLPLCFQLQQVHLGIQHGPSLLQSGAARIKSNITFAQRPQNLLNTQKK